MFYQHFERDVSQNPPLTWDVTNKSHERKTMFAHRSHKMTNSRLGLRGEIGRNIRVKPSSNLPTFVAVISLCGALAVYFVVSGRYILGVWSACLLLAWVFLLGAAIATKKSGRDEAHKGEIRPDNAMGDVIEFRSKPMDPNKSDRASPQRRSEDKFSPIAEAYASKQSPPLWFTEGEELTGRRPAAVSSRSRTTH
jgi:hypothetical protein